MPIPPPINLPPATQITDQEALYHLAAQLAQQPLIAVDTESNSLFAYQERVCLIQFSTPDTDYLVDPLALDDLSPLAPIFANPQIEKVFHAADYDLICLRRDFNYEFANLFDTMQAARILGRTGFGLGTLLEAEFGVTLDKRLQRANWGQRPLTLEQLTYARFDTHYLLPLRQKLLAELHSSGRWELAHEDFTRLCRPEPQSSNPNGERPPINGAYDLTPQQYAILIELCAYRDQVARKMDRPLFKVIGDDTLLQIAQTTPSDTRDLSRLHGMTPRQIQRHGHALLSAVRRGQQAAPVRLKRPPRRDESYLQRVETLRIWRKQTGQTMQVESDIILPRDLLHLLAEKAPATPEELNACMADAPWRLAQFGSEILKVLNR